MVVAEHVAQAEGLLSAWAKEEDDMMVVKLELGLQDNQGPRVERCLEAARSP